MAKKKVRQKKERPEKPPKMQSSAPRRFGAWVFVIFMIFMMVFAIYKVVKAPTERTLDMAMERQIETLDQDSLARTKAVNFAERFAIAYFTYEDEDDYVQKMSAFYADGISAPAPSARSKVDFVGTGNVNIDGDKVDVDVTCQVEYITSDRSETYDLMQFITIRVPIKIDKKGNCAVVAIPVYVDSLNSANSIESVMGTISPDTNLTDKATIEETIKNFFTTYYKGTPSELKYYITKNYGDPATIGLEIDVVDVQTKIAQSGDKWIAECDITINNTGVEQVQHCYLELVKGAEGRYYINKLYTM